MTGEWPAVWLTLQLAAITTAVLLVISLPLAWWLASTQRAGRVFVEAMVALPLVLPPTVLGFYMLLLLGPDGPLGRFFSEGGLAFTFEGLVIGSVVYSLPFVVQPLQTAFEAAGRGPLEAAATLGAPPRDRFLHVLLPMARPGLITGAMLGFAHTLGEFGVVLMIGGNIPGETRVLSIAIYDRVEQLDYTTAHWMAGGMLVISFVMLVGVYFMRGRSLRLISRHA